MWHACVFGLLYFKKCFLKFTTSRAGDTTQIKKKKKKVLKIQRQERRFVFRWDKYPNILSELQ